MAALLPVWVWAAGQGVPLSMLAASSTPGFDPISQLGSIAVLVVPLCGVIFTLFKLLLASWERERQQTQAAVMREREIGNTFLPIMQTMSELLNQVPTKIQQVVKDLQEASQQEKTGDTLAQMQRVLKRLENP